MAGRKPNLNPCKTSFLAELKSAESLVKAIQAVPSSVKSSKGPSLHPKYKVQVVELAFMGVVAAWEEFLEATLVRYVAGAKTAKPYAPSPKFGLAINLSHAYQLLSGKANFNPQTDYLKASDASWVLVQAKFFFSLHPYGCLSNRLQLLGEANKIRNRVAHSSKKCKADFKVVAIRLLKLAAKGKLKQSYTAGNLLMAPTTSAFGTGHGAGINHFSAFIELYRDLANKIVP